MVTSAQQGRLDKCEVLFDCGDWAIIKDDTPRRVIGYHIKCKCIKPPQRRMSWLSGEKPQCHYCHDPVPDEIQTLIHLYSWP